jgi:hypothetical protein
MDGGAGTITAETRQEQRRADQIEFAATVLMAVAAILTAWAAFQSTKWSGVQADSYSRAGAARTESARGTTVASTQRNIDVGVFLQWLQAYRDDRDAQLVGSGPYEPNPDTLSGFLATRFRREFRPAFDAWVASRPLTNPDAAATPFELPEYKLAVDEEVALFEAEAEQNTRIARAANQRGDNYVLLTVMFAIALFFAGVSGKLDRASTSAIAFGASLVVVLVAAVLMATFPIEI